MAPDSTDSSFKAMRSTLTVLPSTPRLAEDIRVPFGITCQPLRLQTKLNVVKDLVTRCRACRAYLNPYVQVTDNKHWICSLCSKINNFPESFYYNDNTNEYLDPRTRPELLHDTFEFLTNGNYDVRPPSSPYCYFFVFELSEELNRNEFLAAFFTLLEDYYEDVPHFGKTKIGFLGFDQNLHFVQFSDFETKPRVLVTPDYDEVFVPGKRGFVVGMEDFEDAVELLLEELKDYCADNCRDNSAEGTCLGTALETAFHFVESVGCGRVTVLTTSCKKTGQGSIHREAGQRLSPEHPWYKQLALKCVNKLITFDIFYFGSATSSGTTGDDGDLATINDLNKFTGGSCYHFEMGPPRELSRFTTCMKSYLKRNIGCEAVLRVRYSKGLALDTFYGNHFLRSNDLVSVPVISSRSTLAVKMRVVSDLAREARPVVQFALLYSSHSGDRRIRVHTVAMSVSSDVQRIYQGVSDQDVVSLIAKMAAEEMLKGTSTKVVQDMVENTVTDVLTYYHKKIGLYRGWMRETVVPPCFMQLIRMYTGFSRSEAFAETHDFQGQRVSVDRRIQLFDAIRNSPTEVVAAMFVPLVWKFAADGGDVFPTMITPMWRGNASQERYFVDCGVCGFSLCYSDGYFFFEENSYDALDAKSKSSVAKMKPFVEWLRRFRGGDCLSVFDISYYSDRGRNMFLSKLVDDSFNQGQFPGAIQNAVNLTNQVMERNPRVC